MRLDYTCVEAEPPRSLSWVHELRGTRFEEHLNRQATTIEVRPDGQGSKVLITTDGELKGAAKLASLALKGDQKTMLDQALDALGGVLGSEGSPA